MALKAVVVADSYSALGTKRQRDEWLARFCSRAYFEERMGPDAIFVGVGPRDFPLGMGALKVRDGKAYFGDLYCRQQRNGFGSKMFEFLADLARRRGLEFGVCDVFSTNAGGLRFVARLGFAPCSSYEEPSFKVDVIRLERPL